MCEVDAKNCYDSLALSGQNASSALAVLLMSGLWLLTLIGRWADLNYRISKNVAFAVPCLLLSSDVRPREIPLPF